MNKKTAEFRVEVEDKFNGKYVKLIGIFGGVENELKGQVIRNTILDFLTFNYFSFQFPGISVKKRVEKTKKYYEEMIHHFKTVYSE